MHLARAAIAAAVRFLRFFGASVADFIWPPDYQGPPPDERGRRLPPWW